MLSTRVKDVIRDIPDFPKPGIIFKDITPLFLDAKLSEAISDDFVQHARSLNVNAICGVESRGFLFGTIIAQKLGVPFILIRKKGKLPGTTIAYSYDLEYGSATIEMHHGDLPKGSRVLIHDDLLATGGTAVAAAELVKLAGSEVAAFSFIINLSFLNGEEKLKKHTDEVYHIVSY